MNRRTALGGRGVTGPWFTSRGVDARDVSEARADRVAGRAESLAELGSSARWRRTMALPASNPRDEGGVQPGSRPRAPDRRGRSIVLMLVLTAVFGVQQTGPSYQIVAGSGQRSRLPF